MMGIISSASRLISALISYSYNDWLNLLHTVADIIQLMSDSFFGFVATYKELSNVITLPLFITNWVGWVISIVGKVLGIGRVLSFLSHLPAIVTNQTQLRLQTLASRERENNLMVDNYFWKPWKNASDVSESEREKMKGRYNAYLRQGGKCSMCRKALGPDAQTGSDRGNTSLVVGTGRRYTSCSTTLVCHDCSVHTTIQNA